MDTLTHALVGVAISRAGFQGRVPYATTALVIAANLPDLDIVFGWNNVSYLAHHRGLFHSLVAWPIWTVLVALALHWAAGWRQRRLAVRRARSHPASAAATASGPALRSVAMDAAWSPPAGGTPALPRPAARGGWDAGGNADREAGSAGVAGTPARLPGWGICLLLGAVGVGSHLLLDWTNSYGIRLLAPFSRHWFALDLEPIADPWIWVILLFLLLAPMVLGLVGGEIGARKRPHRTSAILALLLVAAWVGWRGVNHARAVGWLATQQFAGTTPRRVAAFPDTGTPRAWRAVIELPDRFELGDLDTGELRITNLAPQTIFKPAPQPAIQLAESTHAGQIFLRFARFPFAEVGRDGNGNPIVLLTDLRYKPAFEPPEMGLVVRENRRFAVTSARFRWRGAAAALPGVEAGR